jgi:hypothetical protein
MPKQQVHAKAMEDTESYGRSVIVSNAHL